MLVGKVVCPPTFKDGMFRKGVELSHTHLSLKGEDDGKTYDVAIDELFASRYQQNRKGVPAPLNSIAVGDKLEVCGWRHHIGLIGLVTSGSWGDMGIAGVYPRLGPALALRAPYDAPQRTPISLTTRFPRRQEMRLNPIWKASAAI